VSQNSLARTAGLLYAINIVIGITALIWTRQGYAAADMMTLAGALEYALVVVLLGRLFEPTGRALSWTVAAIGLIACALSAAAGPLDLFDVPFNVITVFGPYCVGLGILVVRSKMMPSWIGLLLVVGGLSWLTFLWPSLSRRLAPWNTAAGGIPELLFTLWLLFVGVRAVGPQPSSASAPA
jgi:hypothetical protein